MTSSPAVSPRHTGAVISPIGRRNLLAALVAVPAIGMFVAACGASSGADTTDPATTDPATTDPATTDPATTDLGTVPEVVYVTDADTAIIRLSYEGGFVPENDAFSSIPTLVVAGDGLVYTPAPMTEIYPGPLVAPVDVRTITPAGIQQLLAIVSDAGLLADAPDYSTDAPIADAPNTVLQITVQDRTYIHSAYALGITGDAGGEVAPESSEARQRLYEVVEQLQMLSTTVGPELGPEARFVPTEYRIKSFVADEASIASLDPAPTIAAWPASTGLALADAVEATLISAELGAAVLDASTTLSWFRDGEPPLELLFYLAAAAALPGDRLVPVR